MKIDLFPPDFREFVRNKKFSPEGNEHPVFYYEQDGITHFYKPIGEIIYCVVLMESGLPENITLDNLKQEFGARELPSQPDAQKSFTGTIS